MISATQTIDLWKIPLSKPPPGVNFEFGQKSDLLDLTISMMSILSFLIATIIALRIWRAGIAKRENERLFARPSLTLYHI
jgi:hypothetical protein